ncbi:hypothetical protein [Faecalispora anaeroviscerum]|uniref:hypothetical protein n=1 Tax=Faecalispora anaeroviscerum TaxID=2991836 RepID=UPI0024BBD628|nr:hypothetical protein [Faecalispora anaeroviscerum]
MNNQPTADEVIKAIGAMAEMSWVFYSTAVQRGFTAAQALQLTQTYLSSTIMKPPLPPQES